LGGSQERSTLYGIGVYLDAAYLDHYGLAIGYNRVGIEYKGFQQDITQNELYLSGRFNLFSDAISGHLTPRLYLHYINNDETTRNTDNVRVIAPRLSYLSFDKKLYLDTGTGQRFHDSYRAEVDALFFGPRLITDRQCNGPLLL